MWKNVFGGGGRLSTIGFQSWKDSFAQKLLKCRSVQQATRKTWADMWPKKRSLGFPESKLKSGTAIDQLRQEQAAKLMMM